MHQGYIKLYRKICNWEWSTDIKTFRLFIHLLLLVNRNPVSWRGVKVDTGETVTSIASLSSATGLSAKEVRTALEHLKKTGEITVKATKFYTLIRVENYSLYQGFEQFEQHTADKEETKKRQSCDKRVTTNNKERIRERNNKIKK